MEDWEVIEDDKSEHSEESEDDIKANLVLSSDVEPCVEVNHFSDIETLEQMFIETVKPPPIVDKKMLATALVFSLHQTKNFDSRLNILYAVASTCVMFYKHRNLISKLIISAQISYKTYMFYNRIWRKRFW